MRRLLGRGGSDLLLACALLGVGCEGADATTPQAGGLFIGGATSGGSSTVGGGASTGAQSAVCSASPLRFPLTRYTLADIDGSLDLVFGEGAPRLADTLTEPPG